jgi:hypothetical protein
VKAPRTSAVRPPSLGNLLRVSLNKAANLESDPDGRKVHAVRKEMKRARSVLRLMRRAVGDRAYRSANARVRDAARPLTPVRDAEVLLHTLDSICRDDRQLREASAALRSSLEESLRRSRGQLTRKSVLKSGASLRLAVRRLQGRPDHELHEWRKQASLLGEDHDLALLRARIREPGGVDTSARMLLAVRIKRRRRGLQKRARKIGKRLYRRSTRDFGATLLDDIYSKA